MGLVDGVGNAALLPAQRELDQLAVGRRGAGEVLEATGVRVPVSELVADGRLPTDREAPVGHGGIEDDVRAERVAARHRPTLDRRQVPIDRTFAPKFGHRELLSFAVNTMPAICQTTLSIGLPRQWQGNGKAVSAPWRRFHIGPAGPRTDLPFTTPKENAMTIDDDKLNDLIGRFVGDFGSAMHAATVVIGDKLGLYTALAERGPITGADLAQGLGFDPRLVEEWLAAQFVSGYAEYDPTERTFWLTEEQAAVLADDTTPAFLVGAQTITAAMRTRSASGRRSGPAVTARRRAADAGIGDRVSFEVATAQDFPGTGYQLVCIFDALHDMGDPIGAGSHIRASLAQDGTWLLVEPMAVGGLENNVNPVSRIFYAGSVGICTPAAQSQAGGYALGNQVSDEQWGSLLGDAGFRRFRRAAETPFNRVFEVRP